MATMNVSLPDDLKSFVDSQVNHGNYGSTSEYIRDLIRHDYDRRQLRDALLDGARSPTGAEADPAYFESLRDLHPDEVGGRREASGTSSVLTAGVLEEVHLQSAGGQARAPARHSREQ